ncbi:MAG: (2Fe-2S) ferredoxin domain-containing protein, partial [Candidatus Bathyarchaeia archaeon]
MEKKVSSSHELEQLRSSLLQKKHLPQLRLCLGTGCRASGAENVMTAFEKEMKKQGLTTKIEIKKTGCHG